MNSLELGQVRELPAAFANSLRGANLSEPRWRPGHVPLHFYELEKASERHGDFACVLRCQVDWP